MNKTVALSPNCNGDRAGSVIPLSEPAPPIPLRLVCAGLSRAYPAGCWNVRRGLF